MLYEGRQIYFGPASDAKAFFERQGWYCPTRQTTGDFLTSVTNPLERKAREGMEEKVPRTPEDFERYWRASPEYHALQESIADHSRTYDLSPARSQEENPTLQQFRSLKKHRQARHAREGSPYTITVAQQISLNTKRAYQRIWGDKASTVVNGIIQIIVALIMGSIFYSPVNYSSTAGFYSKGAALFIAILSNALQSVSEISNLYAQRPIVEKHAAYAFYHPATEAFAGIVADIPVKFFLAVCFNLVIYFMAGLRREAGPFFLFFLITYMSTFVFSGLFRTVAGATKTVSQAMTIAGLLILALTIYTGFIIAVPQMKVWFGWLRWLNPLFYAFEILISNEFHGREFICSAIIPSYTPLQGDSWMCNVVGAVPGRATVSGDSFILANYEYAWAHTGRNFGILIGFLVFFTLMYITVIEVISGSDSAAEFLVFRQGHVPAYLQNKGDVENQSLETTGGARPDSASNVRGLKPQTDIFTWKDVTYDIKIKEEERRLLDKVSGWVKPGTLTTLMGVSGAGKTTLLDVLAQRTSMGVITGDMLVNGKPLDGSFQRKTGYVQQQGKLGHSTATYRLLLRRLLNKSC